MADTWGSRIRLSIFGESHGPAVGMVMDGLPPGEAIDLDLLAAEMARRAPGNAPWATARQEADKVEILSGLYQGKTTGNAVCGIIRNQNARSSDYTTAAPRPGHADYTALLRYGGHANPNGGGHFSGRLTAALVFAGALAKQVLARQGIAVHGRIAAIAGIADGNAPMEEALRHSIAQASFAVWDAGAAARMQKAILDAKAAGDSVGGIIELTAFGIPGGWGDPFFHSLESAAASLLFSIPAVKGVEFGDGFALAALRGSQANDAYRLQNGQVHTASNHCGGVLGGISTGAPVVARLAIKPTPSIATPQQSVRPDTNEETTVATTGRHDPCIVPRAVPVAEAALALAILDCMPEHHPAAPPRKEHVTE